ncbi:MAG: 1-acyl-sn-glycerol-3-phosphate acyltransferase [Rickettsiales bacterium]|jgi:1-acyl-sn-glycerol-3-phosphate acyltransferase|nr:1-acyl-sn-glycerol-3-phosphate acyltransferase [Rickettsiales bacterium]
MFLVLATVMKKCFRNTNFFLECTKSWATNNVTLLKYTCGVKYRVLGAENVPEKNFVAVSKHQSTWECYFLHAFLPGYPVSVSKKEISSLPLFGFAIKNIGTIEVDREDGIGSVKSILEKSRNFIRKGRNVFMMFPQGTRVPPEATSREYPYKAGFLGVARANGLDILPIYLDSGKYWPRGKFTKNPGTITVVVLPPLKYEDYRTKPKEQVLEEVEQVIEVEGRRRLEEFQESALG